MPKVSLGLNSKRVIGRHLPTPIFRYISLENVPEGESYVGDLLVRANIEVTFTKPKEMIDVPTGDLIEHYLDQLCLYVFVSPWTGINNSLEQKKLALKDLFAAYTTNLTVDTFVGPGYAPDPGTTSSSDLMQTSTYDQVIEYQKQLFIARLPESYDFLKITSGTEESASNILGYSLDQIPALIDNPQMDADPTIGNVNPIYRLFWGTNGKSGKWNSADLGYDMSEWLSRHLYELPAKDGSEGYSFMSYTLADTLQYLQYGGFGSPPDSGDKNIYQKFRLSDLAASAGNEGAPIIVDPGEFDANGDELIKISNIDVPMYINTMSPRGDSRDSYINRLAATEKLMAITTIGLDIDALGDTGPSDKRADSYGWGLETMAAGESDWSIDDQTETLPSRGSFNMYFGNIVYEQILENGQLFERPVEAFYYVDDNTQYEDIPIQAWNYKYYTNEPISRNYIIGQIKSLINSFSSLRLTGSELDGNLMNLENILETYSNSPNIFKKFRQFARTYSNKSQATVTGRFYNDFITTVFNLNQQVMSQQRVRKLLLKNAVLRDNRTILAEESGLANAYVAPYDYRDYGSMNRFASGTPESPFASYIPEPWARYTSNVRLNYASMEDSGKLEQDSEWYTYFAKILGLITGRSAGAYETEVEGFADGYVEIYGSSGLDISGDVMGYLDSWKEAYESGYYTFDEMVEQAEKITDRYFASNSEYEYLGMHDFVGADGNPAGGGWKDSQDHRGNRIVVNRGVFNFDWEKALHTQSALSLVVEPAALQRWLGYRCPYNTFRMITSGICRRGIVSYVDGVWGDAYATLEARFATHWSTFTDGEATGTGAGYGSKIAPNIDDFPVTHYSRAASWGGTGADTIDRRTFLATEALLGRIGDDGPDGWEEADAAGGGYSTGAAYSCLKLVNFDVANADISGIKTLRNWCPSTPEFPWWSTHYGTRPAGDYRLATFEFVDMMDDDVAYYNFVPGTDGAESDLSEKSNDAKRSLETMNTAGQQNAQYLMYVAVEDRSLRNLEYLYVDVLKPVLERFIQYKEYAEELCSYNNIEDVFNDFFADGAEEYYAAGTPPTLTNFAGTPPPQPPWYETPYVIAALTYIFQRAYATRDLIDYDLDTQIFKEAAAWSKQCNPRTGTLSGVEKVLEHLEHMLTYVTLENVDIRNRVLEVTGRTEDDIADIPSTSLYYNTDVLEPYAVTTVQDSSAPGMTWVSTSGGTLPSKCSWFFGSMQADQPIFGDVMLDTKFELDFSTRGLGEPDTTGDIVVDEEYTARFGDIMESYRDLQEAIAGYGDRVREWLEAGEMKEKYEDWGWAWQDIMLESLAMAEIIIRSGTGAIIDLRDLGTIFFPAATVTDWASITAPIMWSAISDVLSSRMTAADASILAGMADDTMISMINDNLLNTVDDTRNILSILSSVEAGGYAPTFVGAGGVLQAGVDNGFEVPVLFSEGIVSRVGGSDAASRATLQMKFDASRWA